MAEGRCLFRSVAAAKGIRVPFPGRPAMWLPMTITSSTPRCLSRPHLRGDLVRCGRGHRAPGLRFHDLRHTGNTFAAATGVSTRDLMARMGDDSINAAIIYQHATRQADRVIAEALDTQMRAVRRRAQPAAEESGEGQSEDIERRGLVARGLHSGHDICQRALSPRGSQRPFCLFRLGFRVWSG